MSGRASTIATRPHGGQWTVLGRGDHNPGGAPSGESWSWNDWGPDVGSFTIPGRPDRPDLAGGAPVRVLAHGACVWGGRVRSVAPAGSGMLAVQCEGHQYALDDDQWRRTWVRDRLEGFVDIRSGPASGSVNANLFPATGAYLAEVGNTIQLGMAAGTHGAGQGCLAIIDLGQADADAVSVDWTDLTNGHASVNFLVQAYDDAAWTTGGVNASFTPAATNALAASGTLTASAFGSTKRYVGVGLQAVAPITLGAALSMRITAVRVSPDTALMSGGASILKATDVLDDVRAALTWISSDTSRITATSTNIPHLTTEGAYESHRATLQRANAWHDWILMVDQHARLVHMPRPAHATLQIGAWSGAGAFQDTGRDLAGAVNRVIVAGTDPAGRTVQTEATETSSALSRAGITRTRTLDVGAALNSSDAAAMGAVWLARMATQPTRGAIATRGLWVLRDPFTGAVVPPALAMTRIGEVIRISGDTDPDTGGIGRHGVIQGATWTPADDALAITIDAPTDHMDAFLTRLQAVRASIPAI